ncbi:MAG: AAA family ATPase [Cellulomonadaceae bacterium]|jgi:chromosome segregation protein|nr:AAA family ATPase [Cellulomonadaceae bacterium]
MHLKTLTLRGFKSFASATRLDLTPGITCVVGPNGSGKSNVVDALAWVMGEQGARALRGEAMADVIFAGTSTRPPLGRAEVSLTIDNADGALPIDYTEVTLTRTLFRSGGSEYAINGSPCRLLDIQELLSDVGLGRQMHVVVGQGQLDTVLRATPEQRRGFIEEAAGVLKHRKRKEAALRKLDRMAANLARLSDLTAELRRQLGPLGRQAEAARRAGAIQADLRDATARLLADDIAQIAAVLAAEQVGQDAVAQEQALVVEANEAARQAVTAGEQAVIQAAAAVHDTAETFHRLTALRERLAGLATLAAERARLLAAPPTAPVGPDPDHLDAQASEARGREAELAAEVARATQALTQATTARESAEAVAAVADQEVAQASKAAADQRERQARLAGQVAAARSRVDACTGEAGRLQAVLADATARAAQAQAQHAAVEMEIVGVRASAADLIGDRESADALLDAALAALRECEEVADEAGRDQAHWTSRAAALAEATAPTADAGNLLGDGVGGMLGSAAQLASRAPGFSEVMLEALDPFADLVFYRDRGEDEGSGDAIAVDGQGDDEPAVALGKAQRVVDLAAALTQARDQADQAQARCDTAHAALTTARTEAANAQAHHDAALTRLAESETAIASVAARLTALDATGKAAAAEVDRLHASLTAAQQAADQAEQQLAAALAQQAQNQVHVGNDVGTDADGGAVVGTAACNLDVALAAANAARDQAHNLASGARRAETDARLVLRTSEERHRALAGRADGLTRAAQRERQARADADRRAHHRAGQARTAAAVHTDAAAALTTIDASIDRAAREREAAAQAQAQAAASLDAARAGASQLAGRLAELADAAHAEELARAGHVAALDRLHARARDELGIDPQLLVDEYGPHLPVSIHTDTDTSTPYVRADQEARADKARRALARIGAINPLALEEFAALEERHKFLTDQLADLETSRDDLHGLITDIDARVQQAFEEAFADTAAQFEQVFDMLFPGGTGRLVLTDPGDLLTTGIDIEARPAGKKVKRISLLSGGERSLAALGFLVAIFTARPSPFLILDEVEAALDDVNLGRILDVFRQLQQRSQLIVITHQKRTMEIADALYGVTMGSDGVSVVISQRLDGPQQAGLVQANAV